jgi:hypothetical protein
MVIAPFSRGSLALAPAVASDFLLNIAEIIFVKVMPFQWDQASKLGIIVNVVVAAASFKQIAIGLQALLCNFSWVHDSSLLILCIIHKIAQKSIEKGSHSRKFCFCKGAYLWTKP